MDPEYDSFSIILKSDKNKDTFPTNCSSNFTNLLKKDLKLEGFEVGLSHLSYFDAEQEVEQPTDIIPLEPSTEPFFNLSRGDNRIVLFQLGRKYFYATKTQPTLTSFVYDLNSTFRTENFHARITFEYDNRLPKRATIEYNDPDEYKLYIDERLANALGFTEASFLNGTHDAPNLVDTSLYDQIDSTAQLQMVRQKWSEEVMTLDQLENPTINDIILELTSALVQIDLDADQTAKVSFFYNESTGKLLVDTKSSNRKLRLSNFLNTYLGLPENHHFVSSSEIPISPTVANPQQPLVRTYINRNNQESDSSDQTKILVLCNLVSACYFDEKQLPILAVLQRSFGENEKIYSPNHPIFIPCALKDVSYVNIKLVTEDMKQIPVQSKSSLAILNLRKKWF